MQQRNEGEPDIGEFIGSLDDPVLRELAMITTSEVEALSDPAAGLAEAIGYLEEERKSLEEQKLVAQLRKDDGGAAAQSRSKSTCSSSFKTKPANRIFGGPNPLPPVLPEGRGKAVRDRAAKPARFDKGE